MKVYKIVIKHYRSIEHIEIELPENCPLILFGPNNAGKSNILSAIEHLLGERYSTSYEMLDSDYFLRDKEKYPNIDIEAYYDEPLYYDKYSNGIDRVAVRYSSKTENFFHDGEGNKLYVSKDAKARYQSYLIDAERNIQYSFNYSSRYSLLSKFSHRIHNALKSEHKDELEKTFKLIKKSFEETKEYKEFFESFSKSLKRSVKGFVHSLEVDFSAYDPNNYAKSLKIFAKEGDDIRGFEEFGTGEQQILLMAFAKAYMDTFSDDEFLLIIEEPEAHLHPLAQKWLKEYIVDICNSGMQVVVSTHSPYFFDASYLNGLIRVYKDSGISKIKQIDINGLKRLCVEMGVAEESITDENLIDYYSTKIINAQLNGLFAETVIFVEGSSDYYALEIFFKRLNFSLAEHGIEIISCKGKQAIPLLLRLYKAFSYRCYTVFDFDNNYKETCKTFDKLYEIQFKELNEEEYIVNNEFACFGGNLEAYLKSAIPEYDLLVDKAKNTYRITSKQGIAKSVAMHSSTIPKFFEELIEKIK